MTKLDLLVRNGMLVDGQGVRRECLGIRDSRIVLRSSEEPPQAHETIDASGLLVLPGIVDPHVHFYGEGLGGYSRLAAQGGVTTFIGMIRGAPEETLHDVAERHRVEGRSSALVDFTFHLIVHEREERLAEISAVAARGFRSFKMFLAYKRRGIMVGERFLYRAMEAIAGCGGIALIHAEAGELIDGLEQQAAAAGRTGPQDYAPTRPAEAEAAAIGTVALASRATGCAAYIVHLSSAAGLAAVSEARSCGIPLWAETCPQYLLMNNDTLLRHGPAAKIAPPLRTPRDQTALGAALATGMINSVGSDHASYSRADKAKGGADFFAVPFGMPGAPTLFPAMFTWAVDNGVPLPVLVRAMCETPAALFGLGRRKGSLAPGADADFILVDPTARQRVDADRLWPGLCPSPLAGTELAGWPLATYSRGDVVWRNGEILGEAGRGEWLEQDARPGPVSRGTET